jgi:hypothetical protein
MAMDKSLSLLDGVLFGFDFLFPDDCFVSVLSTFFFFFFLDFLVDSSSSIAVKDREIKNNLLVNKHKTLDWKYIDLN